MPTHVVDCDSSDWTLALADVSSAVIQLARLLLLTAAASDIMDSDI